MTSTQRLIATAAAFILLIAIAISVGAGFGAILLQPFPVRPSRDLGVPVTVLPGPHVTDRHIEAKPGWAWCEWPDGRRYLHLEQQLTTEPWA